MKRIIQVLFIMWIVLISLRFFDARFLNKSFVNITEYLFLSVAILISLPHVKPKQVGFVLPVQLIVLAIIVSIFMAYISWDQSFEISIIETIPYLTWIFFFYLLHAKIKVRSIEKIIVLFGLIYAALYFYQLSQSPQVLFGKAVGDWDESEFTTQRGIVRIIFPGAGVFILAIFLAVNKFTTTNKNKWLWFILIVLGLVIPVLQATRQFIFGVLVIYFLHFTKGKPLYKKVVLTIFIFIATIYISDINLGLFKGIWEALERDLNEGENYIRIKAGIFFLRDFSSSNINFLLGNGAPPYGFSDYGKFIVYIKEMYGYDLSDVGIIGMYAMFGVIAIIGYFKIWVKSFTIELPEEYQYLKYYLWYLLLTSLTWFSVYHYHYLMSTVFTLYLYHTISQKSSNQDLDV